MHVRTVCQWLKWCGTDPFYSTVKTLLKIEMIKQKTSDQTDSLHLPPPPPPWEGGWRGSGSAHNRYGFATLLKAGSMVSVWQ